MLPGLLWKSPELLRELDNPNGTVGGTQKGDVYAFGIILYEIIARRGPFGVTAMEPKGKRLNKTHPFYTFDSDMT